MEYQSLFLIHSRPVAARLLAISFVLAVPAFISEANAQARRKVEQPSPEPLPAISDDTAKCSFAFHSALARLDMKPLETFDKLARVAEPGLTGRWLYWVKGGKGAQKAPAPERVCAESVKKSGRERCLRWDVKPADPALAALIAAQPTAEELAVLKSLDSFVADKGAPLEFGSNGRQFATLQRVASELGSYTGQPRHPALCNGAAEMMEFKAGKLSGLKKRAEDVAALAAKASSLARKRVVAARELRAAEARAAAPPPNDAERAKAPAAPVFSAARFSSDPAALTVALLDGLVTPDQMTGLNKEITAIGKLRQARDLLAHTEAADISPASRAAIGAALRMLEAASYGNLQAARMQTFQGVFQGTIEQILNAHRATCTCGS
jgi:hypothetical protein